VKPDPVLGAPARLTNALLLTIAGGLAVGVGRAVAQGPTVLVGVAVLLTYVFARRSFSRDVPILAAIGSVLIALVTAGIGVFVVLSLGLAVRADLPGNPAVPDALLTGLAAIVPVLAIGALGCVLGVATDEFDGEAVAESLGTLRYLTLVAGGGFVLFLGVNLGLLALGMGTIGSVVDLGWASLRTVERYNQVTRLGALSLLFAFALGLTIDVFRLPRYRQLVAFLRSMATDASTGTDDGSDDAGRSTDAIDENDDAGRSTDAIDENDDAGRSAGEDGGTDRSTDRDAAGRSAGENHEERSIEDRGGSELAGRRTLETSGRADTGDGAPRAVGELLDGQFRRLQWIASRLPPVLGIVGLAMMAIGIALPRNATLVETFSGAIPPAVTDWLPVLERLATAEWLRALLAWAVLVLLVLRIGHVVLNWAIHFPWKRYQYRVTRSAGGVLIVLVGVVFGPTIVREVLRRPSLHYVPVLPGGRAPTFVDGEIRWATTGVEGGGLVHSPGTFDGLVHGAVETVGPTALVLAPIVGITLLGVVSLLFVRYVAWPVGRSFASTPILAGWLLFGNALAVAILGAGPLLVLATGVGAVLVWDLQDLTRELSEQLDPAATTTRGELVRLGGTGVIALLGVGIAIAGRGLRRAIGPLGGHPPWQLLLALVCAVLGTILALVYLSYRNA
jgi:hypothetical protein